MIKKLAQLKAAANELDPKLGSVFLPWGIRHPRYLKSFMKLFMTYKNVKKLRADAKKRGLIIPPFLILSITSNCNLSCGGCFASACGNVTKESEKTELMDHNQWANIIRDACKTGVFGFVIAGGEPFTYPDMLDFCYEFKDRLFLIFTNGTVLTEKEHERLKGLGNVAVFVSVEGSEQYTDCRRGKGVHEKVIRALDGMKRNGVLTGISVTINRKNYRFWMNESNLDEFLSLGIKAAAFMEYIPTAIKGKDHSLMLGPDERKKFRGKIIEYRERKPIYIVHSPGDEELFGGCVSAGRGFAHVTPSGDLTPCPVSNIATHNLKDSNLKDALSCKLFREIRKSERLLETGGMPCALFAHPKEVEELAKSVGAYRAAC